MRNEILKPELKDSHRKNNQSFIRKRKLGFLTCAVLILQKSLKSLKLKLNEFSNFIENERVTSGAFTQARAKLNPTLFYELNKKCYAQQWYDAGEYKKYKGHRLLAVDGSKLRLPDSETTREEFGLIKIKNKQGVGSYTGAQSSVMYDLLNEFIIDSALAHSKTGEDALAIKHLEMCRENDLIIFDRGYSGYVLFATIINKKADFICRCASNAFGVVTEFLKDNDLVDTVVTLNSPKETRKKIIENILPESFQLRLVKIVLKSGEVEVLATSLLDKNIYRREDLDKLYAMRWGVETFYDKVKNRLALENFSGKTAIAVKQDFYSTMLITSIESEITGDVNDSLANETSSKYKQKVSKSVSFNAIKNNIIDLLFSTDNDYHALVEQLKILFSKSTSPIRPDRNFSRKTSLLRALNFHQKIKKCVF